MAGVYNCVTSHIEEPMPSVQCGNQKLRKYASVGEAGRQCRYGEQIGVQALVSGVGVRHCVDGD